MGCSLLGVGGGWDDSARLHQATEVSRAFRATLAMIRLTSHTLRVQVPGFYVYTYINIHTCMLDVGKRR